MSGKENIIANILAGAEAEKAETLRLAQEKAAEIADADEAYCEKAKKEATERAKKEGERTVERYVSVANMDVKKILLQVKQEKISAVMAKAEKALSELGESEYTAFLIGMMEKYAEKGDTVVFASTEKARVKTAADFAQKQGYEIRFDGEFSGGLILESEGFDKNLTVSMLLKEYKEGHEAELASILQGV